MLSLFPRSFHRLRPTLQKSSAQCIRGLEEFFESSTSIPSDEIPAGRAWESADLRLKSFDDLHKLWYVLLKERNMLETQKEESRRLSVSFQHRERLQRCNASMARIKQVLSERQHAYDEALKASETARMKESLEVLKDQESNPAPLPPKSLRPPIKKSRKPKENPIMIAR